jgi:hypothetical protein
MRLMEVKEMVLVRMVGQSLEAIELGLTTTALDDLTDYQNNEFVYIY